MEIQRIIRYALSLALTLVFLLHVGEVSRIPILTSLENQAYDARLKITLPEEVDKQVVIVDIDADHIGTQRAGDHNGGKAHATAAMNGNPLPVAYPALVDDGPK